MTTPTAVCYYRTSSATNVGEDKDSRARQEQACREYATRHGLEIVEEFYDADVRGTDEVTSRPGFSEMMSYIASAPARIVLVENASRFARDLVVQLTGHEYLRGAGIELIPVDCPQHFTEDTPTARMVRQILGAVSEFEKNSLVDKLRKARDRRRAATGRCEGRRPAPPAARTLARDLSSRGYSLRGIAAHLALKGFNAPSGAPYGPSSVKAMLSSPALVAAGGA